MTPDIPGYLLTVGTGLVCACALTYLLTRKDPAFRSGKAAAFSASLLVFLPVFGLIGAKLLYFLFRINFIAAQGIGKFLSSLRTEELSYYGGMAGAVLGAFLAAKLFRLRPARALNAFAPAGALLAAVARFAEYFLPPTGTGAYLENPLPFPIAVGISWDPEYTEYYLAVFAWSGLFSLVAFALSLKNRKEPLCMLRTLFYLCLPQIILESLRLDSISWRFVHAEQLLCFLFVEGVLVWYAFRTDRHSLSAWIPALTGLAVCGLLIAGEFALEGKIRFGGSAAPRWLTYLIMSLAVASLAVMEHRAARRYYSSLK